MKGIKCVRGGAGVGVGVGGGGGLEYFICYKCLHLHYDLCIDVKHV